MSRVVNQIEVKVKVHRCVTIRHDSAGLRAVNMTAVVVVADQVADVDAVRRR